MFARDSVTSFILNFLISWIYHLTRLLTHNLADICVSLFLNCVQNITLGVLINLVNFIWSNKLIAYINLVSFSILLVSVSILMICLTILIIYFSLLVVSPLYKILSLSWWFSPSPGNFSLFPSGFYLHGFSQFLIYTLYW